jgi:hypothetical protein
MSGSNSQAQCNRWRNQNQKNHTHTHTQREKTSVVVSCRDIIPFLSREIIPKQKLSRLVSKSKLQRCCSQYVISEPACLQKKYFSLASFSYLFVFTLTHKTKTATTRRHGSRYNLPDTTSSSCRRRRRRYLTTRAYH